MDNFAVIIINAPLVYPYDLDVLSIMSQSEITPVERIFEEYDSETQKTLKWGVSLLYGNIKSEKQKITIHLFSKSGNQDLSKVISLVKEAIKSSSIKILGFVVLADTKKNNDSWIYLERLKQELNDLQKNSNKKCVILAINTHIHDSMPIENLHSELQIEPKVKIIKFDFEKPDIKQVLREFFVDAENSDITQRILKTINAL